LCLGLLVSVSTTVALPQARIMLNNGGFINITNAAYLVVENPAANAITRTTSGHIITEGENNNIRWSIGTTATAYIIPLGYTTANYIPVTFTTSAAAGSGFIDFATYHTAWNNISQLPTGVSTFTRASGADNSAFVIDRFWKIDAQSYTTKPTLTNLLFTYIDAEHSVASNSITESNLMAQRYNTTTNQWGDYAPTGTVVTGSNTVTVASLTPANFFKWWTLVDLSQPLPIDLLSFSAKPVGQTVQLDWSTAIESNNEYFTIQRSADGINFSDVGKVKGSGSSNLARGYNYSDLDALVGRSYYRLKQTDTDGNSKISELRKVEIESSTEEKFSVYPNPTKNKFDFISRGGHTLQSVSVINAIGNTIGSVDTGNAVGLFQREFDLGDNPPGMYLVKVVYERGTTYLKVIKD
jgi:hypothetical protein